jgi:hypothetical protein
MCCRHQLRILVCMIVAVLAAACVKINPNYMDETDGGSEICDGDSEQCASTHYCAEKTCVRKKANGDDCAEAGECTSGFCDTICCAAGGPCCKDQSECNEQTPVCSSEYQCVECEEHDDCQKTAEEVAPFDSPLGLCTPDHVCTCWVENETESCDSSLECPSESNFVCARDGLSGDHFSCLRRCTADVLSSGLACTHRLTAEYGGVKVWAPMTSCYAFNKLDASCNRDGDCSIYQAPPYDDGVCHNESCTYSCLNGATEAPDDNWCPENYTCGDAPEAYCL